MPKHLALLRPPAPVALGALHHELRRRGARADGPPSHQSSLASLAMYLQTVASSVALGCGAALYLMV